MLNAVGCSVGCLVIKRIIIIDYLFLNEYNLILLVTQNFIGLFDFREVFYIGIVTCHDVTMQSSFLASTVLVCVMQNPLFL
jgi:hypothetical protein